MKRGERWSPAARNAAFKIAWESLLEEGEFVPFLHETILKNRFFGRMLAKVVWDKCWYFCRALELEGWDAAIEKAKTK